MMIYARIPKSKKKRATKAVREQHDEWLNGIMSMKTNFSQGKRHITKLDTQKTTYQRQTPYIPSKNTTGGTATKAEPKVYTGDKMLGIATLHKSNAVPVFNNAEAVEISSMRR